jgi:hypothetical protein
VVAHRGHRYGEAVDAAQQTALEEAIARYNRGDYFGAQEELQTVYNALADEERPIVRALMLVACGMHVHFHRGSGRGALNLFRQGLMILDDLRPTCQGIATAELYEALEAFLQDVQDRRKPGPRFIDRWLAPRIRLDP